MEPVQGELRTVGVKASQANRQPSFLGVPKKHDLTLAVLLGAAEQHGGPLSWSRRCDDRHVPLSFDVTFDRRAWQRWWMRIGELKGSIRFDVASRLTVAGVS
jgi:hypothetical protein